MDEEKRTCKTCHQFSGHANFCHAHSSSHAEWDTCPDHETYEEFVTRIETERSKLKEHIVVLPDEVKNGYMSSMWNAKGDFIVLYESQQSEVKKT